MEERSQHDILHHQADPPVPGIGYIVLCCFRELFVLFYLFPLPVFVLLVFFLNLFSFSLFRVFYPPYLFVLRKVGEELEVWVSLEVERNKLGERKT